MLPLAPGYLSYVTGMSADGRGGWCWAPCCSVRPGVRGWAGAVRRAGAVMLGNAEVITRVLGVVMIVLGWPSPDHPGAARDLHLQAAGRWTWRRCWVSFGLAGRRASARRWLPC